LAILCQVRLNVLLPSISLICWWCIIGKETTFLCYILWIQRGLLKYHGTWTVMSVSTFFFNQPVTQEFVSSSLVQRLLFLEQLQWTRYIYMVMPNSACLWCFIEVVVSLLLLAVFLSEEDGAACVILMMTP
jgi:hypothetical protein